MRMSSPTPRARKTPTNVSVRSDLVRRARELRLNLSQVLEDALEELIRQRERAAWLARNEDAIAAYNDKVAARGVFSDDWRQF